MAPPNNLQSLLKKHFGHEEFRPLQLQIIQNILEGRDVFALLPTGGGKSLCYQLPAVAASGLTLVISPLIALMKDQVDALTANGIPATSLNSSASATELRDRMNRLNRGEYKILYVAPERVVLGDFLQKTERWNVKLVAVDEAHCISEWGHDFRPEYRRLPELRKVLSRVPFLALTATATPRVQEDIVKHLALRDDVRLVGSFNRPNLHYTVLAKSSAEDQVIRFIKRRPAASGIVYCMSRAGTESLAQSLKIAGIKALPYHAGLAAPERDRNQEKFLRDDVQVICATIAFGMGINKSNVRFVIHHDLPKNVEGYYQETGRAGRDGLESECLLLFGRGDIARLSHFIRQKTDQNEIRVAKQQLDQMVAYAESNECRRKYLLRYFGEKYAESTCGNCDQCQSTNAPRDFTIEAKKLLSCVYRVHQQCGFNVGLATIAAILRGELNATIERHSLHKISTFNIGHEINAQAWFSLGRELLNREFLAKPEGEFETLMLTALGLSFLKSQDKFLMVETKVSQAEPRPRKRKRKSAESVSYTAAEEDAVPAARITEAYDSALFEELRRLRKELADEREVPPFIIFSDASLRDMARKLPKTIPEFLQVSGVGEKKAEEFAEKFTRAIREFSETNGVAELPAKPLAPAIPRKAASTGNTRQETLALYLEGVTIAEIAARRELTEGTIYSHLIDVAHGGITLPVEKFFTSEQVKELSAELDNYNDIPLKPVFEKFGGKYHYGQLRLYREVFGPGAKKWQKGQT